MMKKIIFALILLILIPTTIFAWDDCPHGEVLCEGKCGLFIDTDNDGICDHSQPAPENRENNVINTETEKETEEVHELIKDKQNKKIYHLLPISLSLVLLYAISHLLSKKKIISIVNHRNFWNILLLITFLISGILGILLAIRINFGKIVSSPFNILFWHVEIGIAMFAISTFHILWHLAYFKNLFKIKK
jgi:hypothetical protein